MLVNVTAKTLQRIHRRAQKFLHSLGGSPASSQSVATECLKSCNEAPSYAPEAVQVI
jgi:hypothetical protein